MSGATVDLADAIDVKILLSVLAQVKGGDFTARMPLEWTGVAGKAADGLNDVIIANQALAAELARVNSLIDSLVRPTSEMRRVIGAVADGDLSKKVSVDVHGEMLDLKNTINALVDQLNGLVSELARVTCEVGAEGELGGQAQSKEVGGAWKVLTDNVNQLAANLRETTGQNIEQNWLKTNRERFTGMLQGQRDLAAVSSMILSELAPLVSAQHAVFYSMTSQPDGGEPVLQFQAGYGYEERRHLSACFRLGEGLVGQCAKEKKRILLTEVPGDYVRINSGLGSSAPLNIIVLPILFEGAVRAVVELASFSPFSRAHQALLDQLPESIGLVLNTIEANTLTENVLKQSQSQAEELLSRQEELCESNEDLGRQVRLLADRNIEAEQKNQEVEESKRLVEEKAGELAVSLQCRSEFIANMSHELRTPLNSLLILAEQLEDNAEHTMTEAQVGYASVIRASGNELLDLLDSILELAKVESGTVTAELAELDVEHFRGALVREFDHVARGKGIDYSVEVAAGTPEQIVTDPQRLHRILKNLLANAFKFTEHGEVQVHIGLSDQGWDRRTKSLGEAPSVIALSVRDTGIGIPKEGHGRIFEAFGQADGATTRQYGGTGLGLSISRELAALMGGEVSVVSTPGSGSTFTLYLPLGRSAVAAATAKRLATSADPQFSGSRASAPARDAGKPPSAPAQGGPGAPAPDPVARDPLTGTRVLVVDDDFANSLSMTVLLERAHAEVTVAESGPAALAALDSVPGIAIVLMDVMMPFMDGYETIRAIRALDAFNALPIIAVTGKVVPGEHQRCVEAGANDYVPKPVDTVELLTVMRPYLPVAVPAQP